MCKSCCHLPVFLSRSLVEFWQEISCIQSCETAWLRLVRSMTEDDRIPECSLSESSKYRINSYFYEMLDRFQVFLLFCRASSIVCSEVWLLWDGPNWHPQFQMQRKPWRTKYHQVKTYQTSSEDCFMLQVPSNCRSEPGHPWWFKTRNLLPSFSDPHDPDLHCFNMSRENIGLVGWLCWGLTSQSTIFQSCRDGAIASWVINQYFRGVKCLAQGHNTAAVGLEPRTSRSGVRHSTTEAPRSPENIGYNRECLE